MIYVRFPSSLSKRRREVMKLRAWQEALGHEMQSRLGVPL